MKNSSRSIGILMQREAANSVSFAANTSAALPKHSIGLHKNAASSNHGRAIWARGAYVESRERDLKLRSHEAIAAKETGRKLEQQLGGRKLEQQQHGHYVRAMVKRYEGGLEMSAKFSNQVIAHDDAFNEPKEEIPNLLSLKEIVAKGSAQMLEQNKRFVVRDLTKRFEKVLESTTELYDQTQVAEIVSIDTFVNLKKLWDILLNLRKHLVGENKDDVDESISMVETLAGELSQTDGRVIYQKDKVTNQAKTLKKAAEEAKKVVEEQTNLIIAQVNNTRATMQRIVEDVDEREHIIENEMNQNSKKLKELMSEVQEARRITMLHQPSRVKDMESELLALRIKLEEKSNFCINLQKKLELIQKVEHNKTSLFKLEGLECLGSHLQIISQMENSSSILHDSVQWYRIQLEDENKELIAGATKLVYAPEPFDVGCFLQAEIATNKERVDLRTSGPIKLAVELENYVEHLVQEPETKFNVVILQINGIDHSSNSVYSFHVGKRRLKLSKGWKTKAKEFYSLSTRVCGVSHGGGATAQSIIWQTKNNLCFTLGFESTRERNAAIMLARRFSFDCNNSKKLKELMSEVQEARRITMLHQPSKVKDMESQLQALRIKLEEKSNCCANLHKKLDLIQNVERNKTSLFKLKGLECLGSHLQIISQMENNSNILHDSIQWYRIQLEDENKELIAGATKLVYAPEPFDVGCFLQAEITTNKERVDLRTTRPIKLAVELENYVEDLVQEPETKFNVVILQINGIDHSSNSIYSFHVGKQRLKLSKGWKTKAKEFYSLSTQVCGVSHGGGATAQSIIWQTKDNLSFTLGFESTRERNAAIMLARRFAFDCNIVAGSNDGSSSCAAA